MKSKTQGSGWSQGKEWVAGSVVVLLIIGAGLALFAHPAVGKEATEARTAAVLLALHLATWAYLLVVLGLLFLSVRWLENWWHMRVARVAMSRYSLAPQILQFVVTPPVPSRSPGESCIRSLLTEELQCKK